MARERRLFTEDFRLEAVRRATEPGAVIAHIAEDLDIGAGMLTRWIRERKGDKRKVMSLPAKTANGAGASEAARSGGGPDKRDEEIRALREQVAHLEEECAALRSVAGHYIAKRK